MDWLQDAINARRPFTFGELHVSFDGDRAVVAAPAEGASQVELAPDADALRDWLRFDDTGRYRPLPGARTMRRGWRVRCPVSQLPELLDAAYPLAPRQVALAAEGRLRIESAQATLGRQSGRYESVRDLSQQQQDVVREVLCGACIRTPFWHEASVDPRPGVVPCPEPCSVFVALARELAILEELPPEAEVDPRVPFAAFEEPGNELRERCLQALRERRERQAAASG